MKQFSKDLGNVSLAPKGKWSREQEYERLALVYNACDNLSYVAKINVPSGVDIENREYWQPMNATGYADNNFINLTTENENGTITAYESLEEAVATILPINRRAGATLSFYNLNSDRLDRQAEFELWQFNSTDLANWENRDYWNNIYYNWNVFAGWYIGADALKNHVKLPNVGQYAYVGSNLNDAVLYQCRTNGTWTNTGTKVRNYISVVVSGNVTIGDNGNWFNDGKDTGIPATPAVDEQLDNIGLQLQQHSTEIDKLQKQDAALKSNIYNNFETINAKVDKIKTDTDSKIDTADANLQKQITSNDNDITALNAKHKSLSKTVEGIAVTGGASTATNVTYDKSNSGLNAENAQDAIDETNNKVTALHNGFYNRPKVIGCRDVKNKKIFNIANQDTDDGTFTITIGDESLYAVKNDDTVELLTVKNFGDFTITHAHKLVFDSSTNLLSVQPIEHKNTITEYDVIYNYSGYPFGGIYEQFAAYNATVKTDELKENVWKENLKHSIQISNGLFTSAAQAVQLRISEYPYNIVGAFMQCGFGEYGESELDMNLELFQITQPTKTEHVNVFHGGTFVKYDSNNIPISKEQIEAEKKGETWKGFKVGTDIREGHEGEDIYFKFSNELNGTYCGNLIWRALSQQNHYNHDSNWIYRDYDFRNKKLNDAHYIELLDVEGNNYGPLSAIACSNLIKSKFNSYSAQADYDYNVFTSSIFEDSNGRKYGAMTNGSGAFPLLIYSDDNFATCVAFAMFPYKTTWECAFVKLENEIYLINRCDGGDNLCGYSNDNGSSWEIEIRGGDNNRPRIYHYNDYNYYITGDSNNNRNSLIIRKGKKWSDSQIIFNKTGIFGLIYPDLLLNNGMWYLAYTDSESYGGKATTKFLRLDI